MSEFLGRDPLVSALWSLLTGANLLLFGPRRVGKSRLLDEMGAHPGLNRRLIRVDLQGATSVDQLSSRLWKALAGPRQQVERVLDRVQVAAGVELAPVNHPSAWEHIIQLLEGLDLAPTELLVIALDEVPWWLDALERHSPGAARVALAELRRLRGDPGLNRVRWMLTGSVGLATRASRWHASAELNDLSIIEVPPLDSAAGAALFEMECLEHQRPCEGEAAAHAHQLGGGRPHWIRVLAERARAAPADALITRAHVEQVLEQLLSTQSRHLFQDEGEDHFAREFSALERQLTEAILDLACAHPAAMPRQGVVTAVLARAPDSATKADIEAAIRRLIEDFYLLEDASGAQIRVALPLFARWWVRWRTR